MYSNVKIGDRVTASLDRDTYWVSIEFGENPEEFYLDVWGLDSENNFKILYMNGENCIVKYIDQKAGRITLVNESQNFSFTIDYAMFDHDFS